MVECKKTSPEPQPYGDISGIIKDNSTKDPIEGVSVSITPTKLSTSSDSKGQYTFKRLDPGEYTIAVTHPRYESKTLKVSVQIGDVAPGDLFLDQKKSILDISPIALDFPGSDVSKTIILKNGLGQGSVGFTAKANDSWISISPSNGTLRNTESFPVSVTVDRKGLAAGSYTGTITFNADNNSFQYNITMIVANPNAPSVVTRKPTNITNSSAEVIGEVTSIGGSNITQRGHCWSENPNPTINDTRTSLGAGALGSFNSTVTGLTGGKKYYVRAYAINGNGTGYGEAFPFEASGDQTPAAVILIGLPTDINTNSAKVTSKITNDGGSAVSEHGHVWSTNPQPTLDNSSTLKTTLGQGEVGKEYTSTLTNLKNGTKYYVRAYVVNSVGIGYSAADAIVETRDPAAPPSISTGAPSGIDQTYATFRANLTSIGSVPIIQSGFCWSTKRSEPTITSDSKIELGPQTTAGTFSKVITNLHKGTNYFFRPFVSTQDGQTYYGPSQIIVTLEDKLVFYYPFNGDGDDATPNGNTGSIEGAKLTSDRYGNPAKAYDLSKGSIRVINENVGKWTGEQTTMFWAKISESNFSGKDKVLFNRQNTTDCYESAYNGYMLYIQPSVGSNLYFATVSERNYKTVVAFEKSTIINEWHHFAIVKQADKVSFYLDGFLVKSSTTFPTLSEYYGNYSMRFGEFTRICQDRLAPFDGLIDDIRNYSYALTETEIADVYKR